MSFFKNHVGKGKSAQVEEQVVVRHDVATPPLSPPLVAEEEKPEALLERQATPPLTPPPVVKTPPRIRTPSPKRKEPLFEKEEEEVYGEELLEQPQPM